MYIYRYTDMYRYIHICTDIQMYTHGYTHLNVSDDLQASSEHSRRAKRSAMPLELCELSGTILKVKVNIYLGRAHIFRKVKSSTRSIGTDLGNCFLDLLFLGLAVSWIRRGEQREGRHGWHVRPGRRQRRAGGGRVQGTRPTHI